MIRVYFFGTPNFASLVLEKLLEREASKSSFRLAGAFTKKNSPVAVLASKCALPCYTPQNKEELWESVNKNVSRDSLFLVAAYGLIFPKEVLGYPKLGCFNLHASLLPSLRGASPIQQALLNGEEKTGVTLIQMSPQVDAGDIVAQRIIPIEPEDTYPTLSSKIALEGAKLALTRLIEKPPQQQLKLRKQTGRVTYAPLVKKEDGFVSAEEIQKNPERVLRKIRALTPWPGTYTTLSELRKVTSSTEPARQTKRPQDRQVKILKAALLPDKKLVIKQVQLEGKTPISWKEFENGYLKS